ncbi:hypothetical protein LCM08_00505 [Salipiger pacificus]|nr:hypothetical protein [Alloyangia pacifica]
MSTATKRLARLEQRRPTAKEATGARQKLADFLDAIAARRSPSDEERAEAQAWWKAEGPAFLERVRSHER